MPKPIQRINLWSGPRNVSTALMYSFAQRADTRVIDEPLYAHYLRVSGVDHPGRETVLSQGESDGEMVVRDVILGPSDRPVLFMKQMAHHLVELDLSFLGDTTNVFLIRDPREVVTSLVRQVPAPTLRDVGLRKQWQLWQQLSSAGTAAPVLDSRQLLLNPRYVLSRLCTALELEFDQAMLSWPAGPRPEDGVWAPHWYENVHRSTGFQPYRRKSGSVPSHLEPLLEECRSFYAKLYEHAITSDAAAEIEEDMA